jgi:tRNA-binding EMAP/Myf-like protein
MGIVYPIISNIDKLKNKQKYINGWFTFFLNLNKRNIKKIISNKKISTAGGMYSNEDISDKYGRINE